MHVRSYTVLSAHWSSPPHSCHTHSDRWQPFEYRELPRRWYRMCYLPVVTAHCCRAAPVSVRRPTSSSCSQPLWSPPRGRLRPPLAGAELDRLRGARSLGDALARRLVRRRGVGRARGNAARLARTARRLGAVGGADARRGAPRRGLCRGACSESTNKVRSLDLSGVGTQHEWRQCAACEKSCVERTYLPTYLRGRTRGSGRQRHSRRRRWSRTCTSRRPPAPAPEEV